MYTFDWIARQADLRPDKLALIDVATDRRYSYAEFDRRVSRVAAFLRDRWEVEPGERVALLANNSADYFEILWGCARVGAILVGLNWRLAPPELLSILRDAGPTALIYEDTFAGAARALQEELGLTRVICLGETAVPGHVSYEVALVETSGAPVIMPPTSLDTPWYILYTSGTTGRPKGVIQTHGMVLYNALNIGLPIRLTAADVTLNVLPCFHTGGLNLYTNPTFLFGGTAVIQRSFDPDETLRLLAEDATAFFGVPAIYLFLSQHPRFGATQFRRMRSWACGGAPLPVSLLEAYAGRGIVIQQGFGMTETGPTVFLIDEEHALTRAGSVGKPQLFVDVRLVGAGDQDVPPGELGELLIRGPGVTPGYWRQPDVTAEAFTPDGWLRSGDIARCDEDGYYYIVDRRKDMFISGGENVYPAEVENALFTHPAVADVAVVGVPDERWGEVGRAVVVREPGETVTADELIAFCRRQLASYKVPKSVIFVDELPRNAAGKVLKDALRSLK